MGSSPTDATIRLLLNSESIIMKQIFTYKVIKSKDYTDITIKLYDDIIIKYSCEPYIFTDEYIHDIVVPDLIFRWVGDNVQGTKLKRLERL